MFLLGTLSPSSITQVATLNSPIITCAELKSEYKATVLAFHIVVAPWPLARCIAIRPKSSGWTVFMCVAEFMSVRAPGSTSHAVPTDYDTVC